MTPQGNYIACMAELRHQMHAIVDQLCNHALAAGLGGQMIAKEEDKPKQKPKAKKKPAKPLNDLKPDPARSSVTRRPSLIKTQVCVTCGREMTLGNFRDKDNRLYDECNQCREERKDDIKKRKSEKAS